MITTFHWFWERSENGIAVRKSKLNQSSTIQTNRGKDLLLWVFSVLLWSTKTGSLPETWKEALHSVTSLFLKTCCIWFIQRNFTSSEKNLFIYSLCYCSFAFTYGIHTYAISNQHWRPNVFMKKILNIHYCLSCIFYVRKGWVIIFL